MMRARRRQGKANRPKSGRKKPVELLPELITIILEYILIVPGGIELCPDPFDWDELQHSLVTGRDFEMDGAFETAFQYHCDRLNQSLSPHLGLLTVSRNFSYEALRILYGRNDFRFTNAAGWLGLDSFLEQIGRHNQKRLRSITVAHPYWSYRPRDEQDRRYFVFGVIGQLANARVKLYGGLNRVHHTARWLDAHHIKRHPSKQHDNWGVLAGGSNRLHYTTRWSHEPKMHTHIYHPFKQLEKFRVLRRLRIVFPSWAKQEDFDAIIHTMFVNKSKFRNLELTVVRLTKPEHLVLQDEETLSAQEIAERLEEVGCSWEEVQLDLNGNYEVLDSSASRRAEFKGR